MSQLKVNALVSYSGNTVTLGTSGDTINVASGVTFNTASATVTLPSTINATTINVTTVVLAAGAVGTPSLTTSGDTNTGIFFPAADTIGFAEGGTEVMRINSSGNVGIGTNSPVALLDVVGTTTIRHNYTGADNGILIGQFNATGDASINNQATSGFINLATNNTERMRIDSSGNVLIGKTVDGNLKGARFSQTGQGYLVVDGGDCLALNRLTSDGALQDFYQATIKEGSISVSGSTVSYNGFTGSHWSRFIDESKPDVLRGTVMESLDQMTDWYHVEFTDSENNTQKKPYALKANENEGDVITYNFEGADYQATIVKQVDVKHVMSKISDTSEAKNIYGVFSAWDNDDLINNDFYVASVGSYVVRIKAGQTVSKGDLLQSNGDGTAKVQADDLVRASSFAKVLSNTVIETYEDGSFIVPCSLMC
jgi:hypothetical protein